VIAATSTSFNLLVMVYLLVTKQGHDALGVALNFTF
jgi:hypothetical protein